jgi:hypothetical protein
MKSVLAFAAGSFLAFAMACTLSYVFWGANASYKVLGLLCVIGSVFLLVGFGIGAAIRRRLPRPLRAAGLGAAGAIAFVALIVAATAADAEPSRSWGLLLALPLLGGLSVLLIPRTSP